MVWKWLGKIFACLLFAALIGLVGLIAAFFISFSSVSQRFYIPLIIVTGAALVLWNALRVLSSINPRILNRSLYAVLALIAVTLGGYEINKAYERSVPVVSEQDVDVWEYMPFAQQSKVVSLEEPAALSIDSDLPILDGATALYPLYAAFAQAVYPEKEYPPHDSEVMVNTTPEAYNNLLKGTVDIIFVAEPSIRQRGEAQQMGKELKLTPIGREAFVFFVNADNPVTGLTTEQIQDIYAGKITNWREVGGRDEPIQAFQRPEDSGSQTMLEKIMEGKELMTPPQEDVLRGMGGIIEQTADYRNHKNAIGYSFLFFSSEMVRNGNIRLLAVDGVLPDKTTIADGSYPLAAEFYAVTAGSDNPHVEALIEWTLSPQGQWLVERTGYSPVNP